MPLYALVCDGSPTPGHREETLKLIHATDEASGMHEALSPKPEDILAFCLKDKKVMKMAFTFS